VHSHSIEDIVPLYWGQATVLTRLLAYAFPEEVVSQVSPAAVVAQLVPSLMQHEHGDDSTKPPRVHRAILLFGE
jgi:hypothetical protein